MQEQTNSSCCGQQTLWKLILMTVLIVFVSIFLILLSRNAWKQYNYVGKSLDQKDKISMTGEGKVVVVPDIAEIRLGLSTENKDVAVAQRENSDKINNVIKKLKEFNVEKEDIQTESYNVYPNYDWRDSGSVLTGYKVDQTVKVKIRNLEKISNVISLIGEFKLNQVGGLTFSVDDEEKIKSEARIMAIEQAKSKAIDLADAAGVKLGKVVSFYESSANPAYYKDTFGLGGSAEVIPEGTTSIEAGSQEITVNVTVE